MSPSWWSGLEYTVWLAGWSSLIKTGWRLLLLSALWMDNVILISLWGTWGAFTYLFSTPPWVGGTDFICCIQRAIRTWRHCDSSKLWLVRDRNSPLRFSSLFSTLMLPTGSSRRLPCWYFQLLQMILKLLAQSSSSLDQWCFHPF